MYLFERYMYTKVANLNNISEVRPISKVGLLEYRHKFVDFFRSSYYIYS